MAKKFQILDIPNERSSHKKPIIRGGGILFYIAFFIFSTTTNFEHIFLFIGVSLLAIISFWDDIKPLSVKQRIPVQAIVIALVLYQLNLDIYWPVLIGLLIIGILVINCYNFIDGINGMLGMYSATIFGVTAYLSMKEEVFHEQLSLILLISFIVFGFYNFRKRALFFSGDVGSMTLGILAFFLVTFFTIKLQSPIIILLLGVSLTDTVGTIIKRFLAGKNIFQAHREHIYEQISDKTSWSHLKISAVYAVAQLLINLVILVLYKHPFKLQLLTLGASLVCFTVLYYLINKRLQSY